MSLYTSTQVAVDNGISRPPPPDSQHHNERTLDSISNLPFDSGWPRARERALDISYSFPRGCRGMRENMSQGKRKDEAEYVAKILRDVPEVQQCSPLPKFL